MTGHGFEMAEDLVLNSGVIRIAPAETGAQPGHILSE
jgi:hypothetical protein